MYSNGRKTKPKQKSKMKWIVTGIRYIQVYCLFFSFDCCCKGVITFSCFPGSCCRFYSILISTETKQPPLDMSTSVDTSVFIGYPRLDEKKLQKKNVSQVLETKFVIFIISRSKSENAGLWGAQSGFFNKGKLVILRNATTL